MKAPAEGAPAPGALEQAYELGAELGRGALGRVLRGRARASGASVAVKLPLRAPTPEARARIEREARVLCGLRHPRLVRLLDLLPDAQDIPALVYELVEGQDLEAVLATRRPGPDEVVGWVRDVASGLEALHGAGLVHRDLKPANLMLGADGRVSILDFGLARPVEGGEDLTRTGTLVGTPAYMAPEVLRGEPLSSAADLYALACVVYEARVGHAPFEGPMEELIQGHLRGAVPPVPGDPATSEVLARALAKRPGDRPATATELAVDLAAARAAGAARAPAGDTAEVDAGGSKAGLPLFDTVAAGGSGPSGEGPAPRTERVAPAPGSTRESAGAPAGDPDLARAADPSPAPALGGRRRLAGACGLVGAALVVGLGLRSGSSGGPPRGAGGPSPRTPEALAALDAEVRDLLGQDIVRQARGIRDATRSPDAVETWREARRFLRGRGARLAQVAAPLRQGRDPGVVKVLARYRELELLLERRVGPGGDLIDGEDGLLWPPGEDPGLAGLVESWVRMARFEAATVARDGSHTRSIAAIDQRMAARPETWAKVLARDDLPRTRNASGNRQANHSLRVRDPLNRTFTLSQQTSERLQIFLESAQKDLYRGGELAEIPTVRKVSLRPVDRDLVLVTSLFDWDPSVLLRLVVTGARGGAVRAFLRPPPIPVEAVGSTSVFVGVVVYLAQAALPPDPVELELSPVGLQALGDPSETVSHLEVYQLVEGAVPREVALGSGLD